MKKAKKIEIIAEPDGPTAVFSVDEKTKMSKIKKIVFSVCAVLVVLALSINVFASLYFSFSLFKKDGSKDFTEYSYGELEIKDENWLSEKSEEVKIKNSEGNELKGIRITNEHISHSYIIICHQYGGSPETMVEYAKHFYDLGFNIMLPYMRGHQGSLYNNITFGWDDRADVIDWIESIIEKDKKAKIALFGVSLGANAVTLASAEDLPKNVRLVISDSCYTSVDKVVKEYIKNETHLSSILATELISAFAKDKTGVSIKDADTIVKVRDIELPIMFINGENDIVVPPLLSKKLYENCEAEGVEEVIIENGTHGRNLEADEDDYWANIDAFILNNIGI